jgi:hypothetical protein
MKTMNVDFKLLVCISKEYLFCHNYKLAKICLSNEAKNTIYFCCKLCNSTIPELENCH